MAYWLLKSEPDEFGIEDLEKQGHTVWDGVRNYGARNKLRDELEVDDLALIYHSSCKNTGVAGIGRVIKSGYPDPAQFDVESPYFDSKSTENNPHWFCVDIAFERRFSTILPVYKLKTESALSDMVLFAQPRLSVQPVLEAEFELICSLAD